MFSNPDTRISSYLLPLPRSRLEFCPVAAAELLPSLFISPAKKHPLFWGTCDAPLKFLDEHNNGIHKWYMCWHTHNFRHIHQTFSYRARKNPVWSIYESLLFSARLSRSLLQVGTKGSFFFFAPLSPSRSRSVLIDIISSFFCWPWNRFQIASMIASDTSW